MGGVYKCVGGVVGGVDGLCGEGCVGDESVCLFVSVGIGECCGGCGDDVRSVDDRGVDV